MKLRFKKSAYAEAASTDRAERQKEIHADSTYSRNFSLALLNWETNRQETRFAFNIFDPDGRKNKKRRDY